MNDVMSFGIHRIWKDYYVLDVAGGTGDIAFRLQRKINNSGKITVFDINQNMLDVGKRKAVENEKVDASKLEWVQGDAENLPFPEGTFDLYTISFGIRNCTHVDKVLKEAFRVLKSGGQLAVLEFSEVPDMLKPVYDAYSFNVIPVMGQVVAGDYHSYKYLVESIRKFPNQEEFANMFREAGFENVRYENLSFGICAIHKGWKK
ncbi:hypothetical protein WR25_14714 [Diploscapter pachys]|uniref:2-methoxy-6-polyprenyl-1,4-benzoquinol methylase, mitochondrial n=1 Tax=Diploscapter pachys TaxID=2018661 RepID=A0A2A2J9N1_9BILA|nr:hypothetical protein WR25_14714 [Diploscapter pachys]